MTSVLRKLLLLVIFLSLLLLNNSSSVSASTQTTIYTGSVEKDLESGEIKVSSSVGTAGVVKTIQADGTTNIAYVHSDHLASTVLVTDSSGNKIEGSDIKYYPYGKEVTPIPDTITQQASDRLYTGQRKDKDIDLYFYNARYYNPEIGRFISADKAQGPNRYAYVGNNPIMRNDPSGNEAKGPYYLDKTQRWSRLKIDENNEHYSEKYADLVKKAGSYYQNALKKSPKEPLGKLGIESVFLAMNEMGYTNYVTYGYTEKYYLNADDEIKKLQEEITSLENLRDSQIKDGILTQYDIDNYNSNIGLFKRGVTSLENEKEKGMPIELLDYMENRESHCREQTFLAQYILFKIGIETKLTVGWDHPGSNHFSLLWTNPTEKKDYQLDVMYVPRKTDYYTPMDYLIKTFWTGEGRGYAFYDTGMKR